MATISLEKSLLNEMSHIMGNDDLMTQTIKFVRSIRRKAKAEKVEWEYVPNEETRAAIEECESGKELETLDIANFKAYVKSLSIFSPRGDREGVSPSVTISSTH